MNIEFFGPQNPFSALETEWELQTDNSTDNWQTASSLKKDGDFLRGTQYGAQRSININFNGKKLTGNFTLTNLKVGAVAQLTVNGESGYYHIDSIGITYTQNGVPTLDISAHAHLAGSGHGPVSGGGDGGCRTYTPSLTFPAMEMGVPTSLNLVGDTVKAFTLSQACGKSLRSIRYNMQVNHVDEPNNVGEHLAGDNYDATETLAIEFTGEFGNNDFTLNDGATGSTDPATLWLRDSKGVGRGNTAANQTTLNLTHHVAHDVGTTETTETTGT